MEHQHFSQKLTVLTSYSSMMICIFFNKNILWYYYAFLLSYPGESCQYHARYRNTVNFQYQDHPFCYFSNPNYSIQHIWHELKCPKSVSDLTEEHKFAYIKIQYILSHSFQYNGWGLGLLTPKWEEKKEYH